MNTPNPLVPQGMLPDNRGKSHVRIAVFTILAIHVVLLGALLLQGCKKTADQPSLADAGATNENIYAPPPTNIPPPEITAPPMDTVAVTSPPSVVPPAGTPPPLHVPPPTIVSSPPPTAPSASVVDPGPQGTSTEYVVLKGDSYYTIAKKFGVTSKAIAEANPSKDPSRLKIGDKLVIPPKSATATASTSNGSGGTGTTGGGVYTVKSGDTLWKIARDHGTTDKALRTLNRLQTDSIKVGQKLKLPPAASAPAPAPAPDGSAPPSPPAP